MRAVRPVLVLIPALLLFGCEHVPETPLPYGGDPPPYGMTGASPGAPGDPALGPRGRGARGSRRVPPGAAPEERSLAARYANARALRVLEGQASYYSDSLAGHRTANGDRYNPAAFTAANRSLPFGSVLRVTREPDGPTVYVRVNDRGPFGSHKRILDLSKAAARQLGMLRAGVVNVRVEVVAMGRR